ncbi:CRISPR-associated helicase Cas3' [Desulfofundulus thermobenzoicus]|uniref:CRISPR-associated helicase Cas3 n=1 Tax=Desulfofundulus thermobenzoicus TaxID=29376 RepID=A0A6N7IQB3_9FIRM|nr:CRISPR-associated helicase Cas3' [Desulfofundulus thermobenzoicus]MQL52214.1 CRISPR-associated helicase Cas3' [Desulfofundulus thermobenzoicus]
MSVNLPEAERNGGRAMVDAIETLLRAKPRQTLAGHLADSLAVFRRLWELDGAVLQRRVVELGFDPDLFACLAPLAVYTHDLGKALDRWQQYLDTGRGQISHAVFSALMLRDILAGNEGGGTGRLPKVDPLLNDEATAMLLAVLAHHQMLHDGAFQGEQMQAAGTKPYPAGMVNSLLGKFPAALGPLHGQSMNTSRCNRPSAGSGTSTAFPLSLRPLQASQYTGSQAAALVEQLRRRVAGLPPERLLPFKALYTLLLALVRLCDNEASRHYHRWIKGAGRAEVIAGPLVGVDARYRFLHNAAESFAGFRQSPAGRSPNPLQQRLSRGGRPYVILQAGCGTGKTAAALHFADSLVREGKINRVIFTLPTQFTTSSMYWDFSEKYGLARQDTGIYHSEVEAVLRAVEQEQEDEGWLAEEKFANAFFNKPVNVCTVDHLLYSLLHCYRYADRAFGHIMTAAVIFDEIHYYDSFTLRKIGQCLEILRGLKVPHLIMSATIPRAMVDYLVQEGRLDGVDYLFIRQEENPGDKEDEPYVIKKAAGSMTGPGNRVSVELLDLLEQHLNLRQMVVVNQVERAKAVARTIRERLPWVNVICYHSEFTRQHRSAKEKIIRALFKPVHDRSVEEKKLIHDWGLADTGEVILVSTQVCELSLDISADLMYSEIAPLDALVQRGGRLHRRGKRPERRACRCAACAGERLPDDHVYTLHLFPLDWRDTGVQMPYSGPGMDRDILKRSWELIGDIYSFTRAAGWVDRLYPRVPLLRDDEMLGMIREDAVFGRRPRERYGNEEDEQSSGSFRVRHSSHLTMTVVPAGMLPAVVADPVALLQKHGVRVGRNKVLHRRDAWEVWDDQGINVLHLPYDRETGFVF